MKRILLLAVAFAAAWTAAAKITLPEIIGDNMVLQQQADVKVWGSAAPSATVRVTPSWDGKSYTCQADKAGHWLLRPLPGAAPTAAGR